MAVVVEVGVDDIVAVAVIVMGIAVVAVALAWGETA